MNKVQIPLFKVFMSEDAPTEVGKVLMSGFVGEGPQVQKFENKLKTYFDNKNLITLNSATSALHLTLHLLKNPVTHIESSYKNAPQLSEWPGLKDGDEVLSCPLTCTATNWPILANNLNIKWVDVDPKTCNICLDDLENQLSEKTKVIMLVHWGGNAIDLDRVEKIQQKCKDKYGFRPVVIQDCAHGFGSEYKGKKLGSTKHNTFTIYSFQAIKHLTTVDGGCLILPDNRFYKRAKLLRWYGIDRGDNRKDFRCENDIVEWGFKFHMNDIAATIGLCNFKHIDTLLEKHKQNALYYNKELNGVKEVKVIKSENKCSYWIYTIKVSNQKRFMDMMESKGIMVSRIHERNDKHSCVNKYKRHLPQLDKLVNEMICIPVGWWLSKEDREYIVDCIKKGW
tara:strand:- start:2769 stop:3956 length:1188 start_codon:yes stop_codon:yes gene_type:complete